MTADEPIAPRLLAWVHAGQSHVWRQIGAREAILALTWLAGLGAAGLVLGTRWLPAALFGALFVAGAGYAAYRWWTAKPSEYRVAQLLDRRLDAQDQVATAFYFCGETELPAWAPAQRTRAWRLAEGSSPGLLLPWDWPAQTRWLVGLLALCLVLGGARVWLYGGLALDQPLFPQNEQPVVTTAALDEMPDLKEEEKALLADKPLDETQPYFDPAGDKMAARDGETYEASEELEMPQVEGLSTDSELGDALAASEQGEEAEGLASDEASGQQQGAEGEEAGDDGEWSEESNSLLDKLQDAFQNMLQTLDMESPASAEKSKEPGSEGGEAGESQEATDSGEKGEGESDKGNPGEGEPEGEGGEAAESGAEQAGEGQGTPTSEPGENADANTSAAGAADGSKELEDGAIQDVFDEMQQIYQQRAEKIEGEVLVETKDADQKIRTNYQRVTAAEGDEGGIIHREEIPAEYRDYIRRYYDSLRGKSSN